MISYQAEGAKILDKLYRILFEQVYSLAIYLYSFGIWIASFFSTKAHEFRAGRKAQTIHRNLKDENPIWIHCASLGEYEQAIPILEIIRTKRPGTKILVTFFSPSGYDQADSAYFDYKLYLPLDKKKSMRFFLDGVNPSILILIRSELWYNLLTELSRRKIRMVLMAGAFRMDQIYFSLFFRPYLDTLRDFHHIEVLDQQSHQILIEHEVDSISSGNSRVNRLINLAKIPYSNTKIEHFLQGESKSVFMLASLESSDLDYTKNQLAAYTNETFILVPHDLTLVSQLARIAPEQTILYSELSSPPRHHNILIIDQIGMLKHLYKYADRVYVGGGFGASVHNLLEPLVHGKTPYFGPNHDKFIEASMMIDRGLGYVVDAKDKIPIKKIEDPISPEEYESFLKMLHWESVHFASILSHVS